MFHIDSLLDPQLMVLSEEVLETLGDGAPPEEADQWKCDFEGYSWPPILPPQFSIQYEMKNIFCHTLSDTMMFCQSTWGPCDQKLNLLKTVSQNKPFFGCLCQTPHQHPQLRRPQFTLVLSSLPPFLSIPTSHLRKWLLPTVDGSSHIN